MSRVLIVDDDRDARELLHAYLEKMGYKVECQPNGREALMALLVQVPDLMILDLFMPEMSGAGLLEVVRSYLRLQSLPVIVWTAFPDSPMVKRVRELKVNTVLAKGKASLDDIAAAVRDELTRISH